MATNKVTINDIAYDIPELNFNAVCELSDMGVDILNSKEMRKSPFKTARAITAWITGLDVEEAGYEVENHLKGGGDFISIFEAFSTAVTNSGFFSAMTEKKKPVPQDHKRKAKATSEE